MGMRIALVVLLVVGACRGFEKQDFDIDSDEHGQYSGSVSTNCTCGWTNKLRGRVVGGREAQVNEYPYMAGLAYTHKYGGLEVFCGATIITGHHALTAAHCTYQDDRPMAIIVGEHDLTDAYETRHTKIYKVDEKIEHELYDDDIYVYDIAILVCKTKIQFNMAVGPACLPSRPIPLEKKIVKVTGWGRLQEGGSSSPILMKANLGVIPLKECVPKYRSYNINQVAPTQFCTYAPYVDSCQRDSGGPIVWLDPDTNRYTVVGIVSFGEGCANLDTPGVNTEVSAFLGWIQKHIHILLTTLVLVLGLVCETWCWGDSYLRDKFDPPDSDEHGQHVGKKRTTCKCGWTNKAAGRIVGDTEAQVNEYPHMVALARKDYLGRRHFFCGGTIATEHHVVTAAHCIATLPRGTVLYIVAGEHQTDTMFETRYTKEYKVDQIIPHEQYNTATYANDIAVLYFNKKIEFSDAVGPACLPKKPVNLEGEYVKVTGWGHEQWKGKVSTVLRKVNLKVISINDCAPKYALGSINTRTPTQFCTYGPSKDSCQGDSGGPVTWLDPETNRYTLVGVVSFGSICASPTPGVNTMVHSHINWLENIIRSTGPNNIRTCCKED